MRSERIVAAMLVALGVSDVGAWLFLGDGWWKGCLGAFLLVGGLIAFRDAGLAQRARARR
jgi:hypothetical protein